LPIIRFVPHYSGFDVRYIIPPHFTICPDDERHYFIICMRLARSLSPTPDATPLSISSPPSAHGTFSPPAQAARYAESAAALSVRATDARRCSELSSREATPRVPAARYVAVTFERCAALQPARYERHPRVHRPPGSSSPLPSKMRMIHYISFSLLSSLYCHGYHYCH